MIPQLTADNADELIMPNPSLTDLLSVATDAAYAAGRRSLAYFNTAVAVEIKSDLSPVTRADREGEEIIRAHIARHFPDHSILGEEGGTQERASDYRWIIDPIDGTKTFIRGVPFYGVLIGVEIRDEPAVGVIYMPALDEMVSAAKGMGCRWNGRTASVSSISQLKHAGLMCTDIASAQARSGSYQRLASQTAFQRTWGDCYAYLLVATGRAEIALDPKMAVWDCAALLPVLEEAGGRFTSWSGQRTIRGGDGVASNGVLHDEAVRILRGDGA